MHRSAHSPAPPPHIVLFKYEAASLHLLVALRSSAPALASCVCVWSSSSSCAQGINIGCESERKCFNDQWAPVQGSGEGGQGEVGGMPVSCHLPLDVLQAFLELFHFGLLCLQLDLR